MLALPRLDHEPTITPHVRASVTVRGRGPFYCVPLVDCGNAILDFENHVLAVAGRRIFFTERKLLFIGILLASRGEPVPLSRIIDTLRITDGKYPQHVVARIAREIRDQIADASVKIAIARGPKGYLIAEVP